MALWERLFAAIPQILDDYFPSETNHYGYFRRRDTSTDDKRNDKRPEPEQFPSSPLTSTSLRDHMHNSQAIAMYHRAMTLQRGNSENMNQHIFAPPLLGQSGSNHNHNYSPSDFGDEDDDDDDDHDDDEDECYSVSSGDSVSS